MAHIGLNSAFLCEDCQQIGDDSKACACCKSQSIVNLGRLLNRGETAEIVDLEALYRREG